MNYFTRARYLALQNLREDEMDAAAADWDAAVAAYGAQFQALRPQMPASVRQLRDDFHDARVLSIGQRGDTLIVSLRLDVPPNDLLTISYTLAGPGARDFPLGQKRRRCGLVVWRDRAGPRRFE
jgi:hypothetical protein